jgi:hypothetical protein
MNGLLIQVIKMSNYFLKFSKTISNFFSFEEQYNTSFKQYNVFYNFFWRVIIFCKWNKSLSSKKTSIDLKQPWVVLFSIPFLKKMSLKHSIVFEFGSGGSTFFFAERVKQVVTVEHDLKWFDKIAKLIQSEYSNVELNYVPPELNLKATHHDASNELAYVSNSIDFEGYSFVDYASFIDKYPDEYFDIILIDGRARPSCLMHSVSKVKKAGIIVLDDAYREYYLAYVDKLKGRFSLIDFPGPVHGLDTFYRTLILKRN